MSSTRHPLPQPPTLFGSLAVAGALLLGGAPAHAPALASEAPAGIGQAENSATAPSAATTIRAWVLHFDGSLDTVTLAAHADLLRAIGPEAEVYVVVPHRTHEGLFLDLLEPAPDLRRRIRFLPGSSALSIWARDRYLVVDRPGARTIVLPDPRSVRPERRGDVEFARTVLSRETAARVLPTRLAFEGGDLLVGRHIALIGAGTILENRARWQGDLDGVVAEFEQLLDRRVVVLGEDAPQRPHDHADMYVHLLDDRTVILGDPSLTLALWEPLHASAPDRAQLGALGWPREEAQRDAVRWYEPIAAQLRDEGFRVIRVPALHGDALYTWTNAVTEMRDGVRHAYVPLYGIPLLDAYAHRIWREAGCVVHPIAARAAVQEGGAVRCLTNTLRHGGAGRSVANAARRVPR